jgi:hypothetical protein
VSVGTGPGDVTRHPPEIEPEEVRELTLIVVVVVAAALVAVATWLALGLCAASDARDELESTLELPAEEDQADRSRGARPEVILRLASMEAEGFVRR